MNPAMADPTKFFVVGGTLPADSPSYVKRAADNDLLKAITSHHFCHVITVGQMGKSSLMIHTTQRLKEEGVATVVIDLTAIGTQPPTQWYLSILNIISRQLKLPVEVVKWWNDHQPREPAQCFVDFIDDVVLKLVKEQIVIFIDEIDKTATLKFKSDFFASVLDLYNARNNNIVYRRLVFVLLGLAMPMDITDSNGVNIFNIGTRIRLQEFSLDDLAPLREGLDLFHPGQGERIIERVFHWTNGHPYLTQRLCFAVASVSRTAWDNTKIDNLVETVFFSNDSYGDSNLAFVQERILGMPSLAIERQKLLELYRDIYKDKSVFDDRHSQVQLYLELSGLVRVQGSLLQVRNNIYRFTFNDTWIAEQLLLVSSQMPQSNSTPEPVAFEQAYNSLIPNALIHNRYLVKQRIGGETGAAYEAFDLTNRANVVLKQFVVGARAAEFERVARPLKGLRHPNLPVISDLFGEGESGFLVLEYVSGDGLEAALESNAGPIPADRVLHLAEQLLDVLDYLHTQPMPMIHGDIRPQNIKLKTNDQAVLVGFGAPLDVVSAHEVPRDEGAASTLAPFLSPEQAAGNAPTEQSDLYSLAGTLYYLLTGSAPVTAKDRAAAVAQARRDPIRPVQALNSRIPAGLSAAIMGALALAPAQRPSSAADMRAIIHQPVVIPPVPPRRRRWLLPLIIGTAAAVVLVALIVFASVIFGSWSPSAPLLPSTQIGDAATIAPAPTIAAGTAASISPQPATPQPASMIVPKADSIEPQQIFTGTLPLTMNVRGVGLDQVRMARLIADGKSPIELLLRTSSADHLALELIEQSEPLNGAVRYHLQLNSTVQITPEIILRDFVEQTVIRGVEAQYTYTERVAVDELGAYARMHALPNIDSQLLGLLRKDDPVDILRIDIPAWYLLRYKSADGTAQIGWLERWLVDGHEVPAASSPTPTPAPLVFVGSLSKVATDAAVQCGASLFDSTIYGTVQNSAGRPISGAIVRVTSADGRNVFKPTTNRKGEYKVTNLGCTRWIVRLISIPNAPNGIRANAVTVSNLNGGIYTSAQVLFRMQR